LTICVKSFCQQSISFAKITLEAASQRANIENKNIFVDAYAPWCGPCKIMDIHFQDKEVRNYFNRNFINVKIDTDTKYGKKVSAKYGIAFLPTVLILDKDGNQRFKVDKLMNRDEILSFAKYAVEGPKYPKPSAPIVSNPPAPKTTPSKPTTSIPAQVKKDVAEVRKKEKKQKKIEEEAVKENNEKILYVLDANATNLPPEILYEEAYFRMQFNDGSHKEASKKYLATQEDWLTEKNIRFIFDFLYNTDSDEFKFFIANKEAFAKYLATQEDWLTEKNIRFIFDFLYNTDSDEFKFFIANKEAFAKYIAPEKIEQSLKILIENKLYLGIPRPSFEQSKYLLSLIDEENAVRNNYYYFLNRLNTEGNTVKYFEIAEQYFDNYEEYSQGITLDYINKKLEKTTQKGKVKNLASLLPKIQSMEVNYDYLVCNSKIQLALSNKQNAINFATEAISLAKEQKIDSVEAEQVLETIKEL